MVDNDIQIRNDLIVEHVRGTLFSDNLQKEIERVWQDATETEEGRADIAHALGLTPQDIHAGPALVEIDSSSGFVDPGIAVIIHWAAVNIVVPIFVGLAKDEVKARLLQLWRDVLLPRIRERDQAAVNDERPA